MKLFHLKSTFVVFLLFLITLNINYAYGLSLSGMGEVSEGMNEEEAKQQEQQLRKQEQLLREQEFEINAIRLRQLQHAYSHLKEPPIITQKGHLKLRKAATEI